MSLPMLLELQHDWSLTMCDRHGFDGFLLTTGFLFLSREGF